MNKGLIIVVSAPSGAGKTTICKKIVSLMPSLTISISVSTRKPRGKEVNGVDYNFISEKIFVKKRSNKEFIEWAKVHGNYYATPKKNINDVVNKGKDIILDIDVVGALKVKKRYKDCISIFILPPNKKVLEKRLRKRKTEDENIIEQRLKNADIELKFINNYDYVIINNNLNKAVSDLKAIIRAEQCKVSRKIIKEK